jgi:hypothetical protein
MDDIDRRFLDLIHGIEEMAGAVIAERAYAQSGVTTLQVFWTQWPGVSEWAGPAWRMFSKELAGPRPPQVNPVLDEVGESG